VARFSRADEVVIRAVHALDHGAKTQHVAVDQLTRRETFLGRGLLNFLAVLVRAGEKEHIIAVKTHEAGDCIRRNGFICMPDVRRAVRIGNRRRNIESTFCH
jgi:hypothetical protein